MVTKLIEPCCAQKQLRELRNILEKEGTAQMEGYGDLSLTELLPAMLTRYSNAELLIAAPSLPDQAAEIIATWMRKQWARMDGCGNVNVIARLTIVSDLSEAASPDASTWLKENPFGDRLTLVDKAQDDTALLLPDIAITGPLNLRYGQNFTCDVTTVQEEVDALWKQYSKFKRRLTKKAASKQEQSEVVEEPEAEEVIDPAPEAVAEPTPAESVTTEAPEPTAVPEATDKEQEDEA